MYIMKTKIVYVLVSNDNDIYQEQTWLSAYTLREHNKDAHVVLVVDNRTQLSLTGKRELFLSLFDEVISIPFDDSVPNLQRSRLLKTDLRSIVSGDFMYIDGDTLVLESLDRIDECTSCVAAVLACHIPYSVYYAKDELDKLFKRLGFETDSYFNGGVLFVKDCKAARDLFSKWHQYYIDYLSIVKADMPSLAKANSELKVIEELGGEWNCQIQYGARYLNRAKIIHYFASNFIGIKRDFPYLFMDNDLFYLIKKEGTLSPSILKMAHSAQSQWIIKSEIIGGEEVNIYHSKLMKVLRSVYYGHPRLYSFFETALTSLSRTTKSIKKLS